MRIPNGRLQNKIWKPEERKLRGVEAAGKQHKVWEAPSHKVIMTRRSYFILMWEFDAGASVFLNNSSK